MTAGKGLRISEITEAQTDEDLLALLCGELERQLGEASADRQLLYRKLLELPLGLRAMGATHPLDVSMALDDLGWHFRNWPSMPLAEETLAGLRILGADLPARIFEEAWSLAQRHWTLVLSPGFHDEYFGSELEASLMPLNRELWQALGYDGSGGANLLTYWSPYARAHPHLVCPAANDG